MRFYYSKENFHESEKNVKWRNTNEKAKIEYIMELKEMEPK